MALSNWKLIATGLSICALALSILHGRALKAEVAEKTAVIESMKLVAQNYQDRSEQTAKETSDAFTTLVEQIKDKDTALKNARARFGSCNVAGGITAVGMLRAKDGVGEAYRTPSPDGAIEERVAVTNEFINDCAIDAGRLDAWRSWAVKNDLPVSKD
jgi:hypothetical protein